MYNLQAKLLFSVEQTIQVHEMHGNNKLKERYKVDTHFFFQTCPNSHERALEISGTPNDVTHACLYVLHKVTQPRSSKIQRMYNPIFFASTPDIAHVGYFEAYFIGNFFNSIMVTKRPNQTNFLLFSSGEYRHSFCGENHYQFYYALIPPKTIIGLYDYKILSIKN